MEMFAETIAAVEALLEKSESNPELAIKLLRLENINLEKTINYLRGHNSQIEAENSMLREENKNVKDELLESKTVLASLMKQIKKYENALKKELCINTSSSYYQHNGELHRKDPSMSRGIRSATNSASQLDL